MIDWRPYLMPAFLFITGLTILFVGLRVLTINTAYEVLTQAPLGQSVGPRDAKVTIVEFMDYRCIPCRQLYPLVKQVTAKHPEVRVVFRNMPIGIPSILENRLALAAGMQGKYLKLHDMLMQREEPVKEEELQEICKKEGLDFTQLRRDLRGKAVTENLDRTFNYAKVLGINADPTFLVGKVIYTTKHGMPTMEDFEDMIARDKGLIGPDDEERPERPARAIRRHPLRAPPQANKG
jgi:protein-disulfide isomerase